MFEQAELRGTPMGPNGSPNAKATANAAPGIAVLGILAFLVILVIFFGKTRNLVILASHFRAGGPPATTTKACWRCLDERRRAMCGFGGVYIHRKSGRNLLAGLSLPHENARCRTKCVSCLSLMNSRLRRAHRLIYQRFYKRK